MGHSFIFVYIFGIYLPCEEPISEVGSYVISLYIFDLEFGLGILANVSVGLYRQGRYDDTGYLGGRVGLRNEMLK